MEAFLYSIQKRINSTKRPAEQTGRRVEITLKDDTSLLKPVIKLLWNGGTTQGANGNPTNFNYIEMPGFRAEWGDGTAIGSYGPRWYWITGWTYSERQWVASCEIDVLGTWKLGIGVSEKYVLRSATQFDGTIPDNFYFPRASVTMSTYPANPAGQPGKIFERKLQYGFYIVGITGQGNTYSTGGIGYLIYTPSAFASLLNAAYTGASGLWPNSLSSNDFGTALAEYGAYLQESMTNPYQYINSVMWVPFDPRGQGAGTVPTFLGYINTGVQGYQMTESTYSVLFKYNLPQDYLYDDNVWKLLPPYRRVELQIPMFGNFDIEPMKLLYANEIRCNCTVDLASGKATLEAFSFDTQRAQRVAILFRTTGEVGIQIPISGAMVDVAQGLSTAVNGASNAVTSLLTGNIAGAVSGIVSAAESFIPTVVGGGSMSGNLSMLDWDLYPSQVVIYDYAPIDQDPTEFGRPLCKLKKLNLLSGFIMLKDGEFKNLSAFPEELEQIRKYTEGGFFYE